MAAFPDQPLILKELSDNYFDKGIKETDLVTIKLDPGATTNVSVGPNGLKIDMGAIAADPDVFSGYGAAGSPLTLDIDPAGTAIVTKSPAGLKIDAPASAVTTFSYDAVGKKLTVAVDGTAEKIVDLASLNDEGAKLVINGQNLELQSEDGTVLSSTPIGAIDAQQLTAVAGPAGYKVSLTNGGSITLTCADIGQMYSSGTATGTTELLSKDCKAVAVSSLPISGSQLSGPITDPTVTIAGSAINSPITNPAATIPAANVTGVLPASALPPTVHVNSWTKATGLKESVNTIASDIAIVPDTIVDFLGYNAAGAPVHQTKAAVSAGLVTTQAIDATYSTPGVAGVAGGFLYGPGGVKTEIFQPMSAFGSPLNFLAIKK